MEVEDDLKYSGTDTEFFIPDHEFQAAKNSKLQSFLTYAEPRSLSEVLCSLVS